MAEEERSALEIILELPSILKKIENKIDVLDTNLKILNNKLNKLKLAESTKPDGLSSEGLTLKEDEVIRTESLQKPTATPGPTNKEGSSGNQKLAPKLVLGSIKVFSKIKTSSGKPVDGMTINIFDSGNDLIRNLITDKDGYWECKLPAGSYSIEMIHPRLKTINKQFSISKDMKAYEVI